MALFKNMEWDPSKAPVIGQFYSNPAHEEKRRSMRSAGEAYQAAREPHMQGMMNAFRNALAGMAPSQNAMGSMYGPGAMIDSRSMTTSPLSSNNMKIGAPAPMGKELKTQKWTKKQKGLLWPAGFLGGPLGIGVTAAGIGIANRKGGKRSRKAAAKGK